jgi:hypothetical protein
MNKQDIAVQRLHSQQLERTNLKLPGDVLIWLGVVQAQDYAGAKWSLGLRLPKCTDADVEQAIADKSILRTWVLRGTLHFVAAGDIHWLVALVAPRIIAGNTRRYKELELDEQTLIRSNDLLTKALQGPNQLNRTALLTILNQNGISTEGQRAAYMLQRASLDGLICQGAMHGNKPTFMRLDELPPSRMMERDEALAELAWRYITSRGPATLQDFIWWSGLSVADARAGMDSVQSQFIQEMLDGQTYWWPSSMPPVQDNSQTVYLLPGFDEYLLAYKDRSASLDTPHYKRMTPTNGMLPATIVINGRVMGIWKRTFKKDTVLIALNPFNPLTTAEQDSLNIAAHRFGEFLDMSVVLT